MDPRPAPDLVLDPAAAPAPDPTAEPGGFVVVVDGADGGEGAGRIHFLDWGGPRPTAAAPGVLLIHGVGQTGWLWAPVARRLRAVRRTVAMDLRGHGLSDAPTTGYDEATLAADVVAAAEGSGVLAPDTDVGVVLAGHGFGAVVAAWAAAELGEACAGLVLVDGGWEDVEATSGLDRGEFLRSVEEPPEVLRSIAAYLADRREYDPGTWDADQERAARATVVETAAGRVVPGTRPHVVAAVVDALFDYRPVEVLAAVTAPIIALVGAEDEEGTRRPSLARVQAALAVSGRAPIRVASFPSSGHNLMRYQPAEVTAAILAVAGAATS